MIHFGLNSNIKNINMIFALIILGVLALLFFLVSFDLPTFNNEIPSNCIKNTTDSTNKVLEMNEAHTIFINFDTLIEPEYHSVVIINKKA